MSKKFPVFLPVRHEKPQVTVVAHTPDQRATVMMCVALLLKYPTDTWDDVLNAVAEATSGLPTEPAQELDAFIDWARTAGRRGVETLYVTTFDYKRRCSLELSYYLTGDTRQRGIALTIFQDLYAACGWEAPTEHLPDFLPFILELAARSEDADTVALVDDVIASHREGIEILHAALADLDSPWTHVIAALRMALPEVDKETEERMRELVRKGPPSELVGINDVVQLPWPTDDDDKGGTPMPLTRDTRPVSSPYAPAGDPDQAHPAQTESER